MSIYASVVVSMGTFLVGSLTSTFSGALEMEAFQSSFTGLYEVSDNFTNVTCSSGNGIGSDFVVGLMVSIFGVGASGASIVAGWLSDKISRKYGLMVAGLVLLIGVTALTFSFHLWLLIIARAAIGIGAGLVYMIVPVYLAEMSPKKSRGRMGSLIGPCFVVGVLFGAVINIGFTRFHLGWRTSFGLQGVFVILYTLAIGFIPHTPRWLILKHQDKKALLVLQRINGSCDEDNFLGKLKEARDVNNTASIFKLGCKWTIARRMIIIFILFLFGPYAGNVIFYYTPTILCKIHLDPFIGTAVIGISTTCGSFATLFLIDKFGRKILLLCGALLMGIASLVAGVLIQLFNDHEVVGYIIIAIICFFAFCHAGSWLVVPWVVSSEVFPLQLRGLCVGLCTAVFWFNSFVSGQLAPLIFGSSLQTHGYFYISAGLAVFFFFFTLFALPETNGTSLEDVDSLFAQKTSRLKWCDCQVRCQSKVPTVSATNPELTSFS